MKRSGIPDAKGRVGHYPNRLEAEDLQLEGYKFAEVTPWEAASGRGSAQLPKDAPSGSITLRYEGEPGPRDLRVQYFDEEDGVSQFKVFAANQPIDQWVADQHVPTPTTAPDAHSSSARIIRNIQLTPGDEIRIEGTADGGERAGVDYIEITPSRCKNSKN